MAEIYVRNSTELQAALNASNGGETIILQSGSYGSLDLNNLNFSSTVTIKAASPLDASFSYIGLSGCTNIAIDGVHVDFGGNSGLAVVDIENSAGIDFINSEVNGKVDAVYPITGPMYGIYTHGNSSDINLSNNYVHDVKNGMTFFGTESLAISTNTFENIGEDVLKFASVNEVVIENNIGPRYMYPTDDAHADFMQFQGGASSNVMIIGNVFLPQNRFDTQGIFLSGQGGHSNITIEQNIIYTGMANGIVVDNGENVKIHYNTLINALGDDGVTRISASGADVQYNIYSMKSGSISGTNVAMQKYDDSGAYHYTDLFAGLTGNSGGITLQDLQPVAGSEAESVGAYLRLNELLNGVEPSEILEPEVSSPPEPEPTPTPEAESAPTAVPEDETSLPADDYVMFARLGPIEINGSEDVVQVAPSSEFMVKSATIALTFNADTVSGSHGLVSKDAADYTGGGNHFTSYIKNGVLQVRFQDGDSDEIFTVRGIEAGRDYDLQASFGNGVVSVWLDGILIGAEAFETSWIGNSEYLQIGANGWASESGQAGFTHFFDGTISNTVIVEGLKTPDQIRALIEGTSTPESVATPVYQAPDDAFVPLFSMIGDREFSGDTRDIVNLAHDPALQITEGTVALSFNADAVKKQQGLISKDAANYEGGGNHFSVWIKNDALVVRFQDEDSDATFTVKGIEAGREYDVQAAFDKDEVALYLDGKHIGTKSFTMDWSANEEFLQIGGLGWASEPGSNSTSHAFDGTISDVRIFDQAFTPQEYDFFA